MVIFNLKYSEIEGLKRLDPEYYNPAYNDIVKRVRSINSVKLNTVLNIELGPAYSSKKILKFGGIPISKIGDVTNKRDFSVWDSLDGNEYKKFGSRGIKQNEILMTLTGDPPDVGKVNMPFTEFDDDNTILAFNQRVAKLDTKGVDPFYLFTILSTEYFRIRFEQCAFGIRQRNVSIPDLKSAFVYIAETQEIENISKLTKAHFRLRRYSQTLYQQATALLEQELGLDTMSFEKPKSYTATFSEVTAAKRADSEHFTPLFEKLKTLLSEKENVAELKYLLNYCSRGKQPNYSSSGLVALNSKHIRENKVIFSDTRKAEAPVTASQLITKNDVLLNGTGVGTIGRTAPYLEDFPAVPDNHVTILRSDKLDCGYLSVYLNSRAGQIQVNKHLRGSSGQIELYPNDIMKFLVWVAPPELQSAIGDMVRSAYKMENESKQLLQEAKSRVEQLIEEAANQ